MNKKKISKNLKNFWNYIWHGTSFTSYIVFFIVVFFFIKVILFPSIGFLLNNNYPIVAIVSGSMEHKIVPVYSCQYESKNILFGLGPEKRVCTKKIFSYSQVCDVNFAQEIKTNLNYDEWWKYCGSYYEENFNLEKETFKNFDYQNGLNIGDVMLLYGKEPQDIKLGEILVFVPQDKVFFETKGPVIHRVVKIWQDEEGKYHFQTKGDHNKESFENFENDITQDNIIGVPIVRIPYIGYAKLLLSKALSYILGI